MSLLPTPKRRLARSLASAPDTASTAASALRNTCSAFSVFPSASRASPRKAYTRQIMSACPAASAISTAFAASASARSKSSMASADHARRAWVVMRPGR